MDGRARVLTAVLAPACAGPLSACTPALAGKAGFAVGPGWDRGTLVRMSNNLYRTRATTEQIRALDPGQVLVDEDDIGRPVVTVEEFLVIACGNPPTVPA